MDATQNYISEKVQVYNKNTETYLEQEYTIIQQNISRYPCMQYFLGNIIDQRLKIQCFKYGMLTGQLLDEHSASDLDKLEHSLYLANLYCNDFALLFKGKKLPQDPKTVDGQIIDVLAEVKAIEYLHGHGFQEITHIKRKKNVKTVDFSAQRNGQYYAIEVTRLGLAQSVKKQPVYYYKDSKIDYSIKCEDAEGYELSMITEGINTERIMIEISDTVQHEYPQIKEYCGRQANQWKGILILSSGRDYFVAGMYENKAYEETPTKDFLEALEKIHESLKQEQANYKYLNYLIILRDKDLSKAITYPNL